MLYTESSRVKHRFWYGSGMVDGMAVPCSKDPCRNVDRDGDRRIERENGLL